MKSIRQQLTVCLLAGFTLLLGAGGSAVYFFARATLQEQFDAALRGEALAMAASMEQEGKKIEFGFAEKIKPKRGLASVDKYYQLRLIDGPILRRSRSLGTNDLPCQFGLLQDPRWFDVTLPGGSEGRAISVRFFPEPEGGRPLKPNEPPLEVGLVIAADRAKLDRAIGSLGAMVLLGGILILVATVVLVALVLRRGLAPLDRLASQAEGISATSLQTRFPTENVPMELNPISHRLNDLLARLERSFSEISEYAAKVSHELRTPLTILRLKVEQAEGGIPPELAEELHAELHHLTHVVEQSLLIARAEQGRLTTQPRAFDLAALVSDVIEDFSLVAQEDGRRVRLDAPSTCEVRADPKYIRQIIHNLLTNALKHGYGDIEVTLACRADECELAILNAVRREATPSQETLGLGLRVVDTLLALHQGVKCDRHRGLHDYAVCLTFPAAVMQVPFGPGPARDSTGVT